MTTFFQEALQKTRAEFDQRVADLAKSEPTMRIVEMAAKLECSKHAVCLSFRRQGISRLHLSGRPRKKGN